MITAKTVADSINPFDDRLTTMLVTCPRIILAEFNTHRAFSRNSASSRAIPFKKMLKLVLENPFIPLAFQKDHQGMQGTEYFSENEEFSVGTDLFIILRDTFKFKEGERVDNELLTIIQQVLKEYRGQKHTLKEWWLICRDSVVKSACLLFMLGITKQVCNRLLEPFMWHTVIVSATEWENFFALRCPQYGGHHPRLGNKYFRSKKDALAALEEVGVNINNLSLDDTLGWLKVNKGQAEIHMMALAEAMWDAYNESTPKKLNPGEWHIPFGDNIREICLTSEDDFEITPAGLKVKISTAMAARTSYTVVGDEREITYSDLRRIHNKMRVANPFHASPFEHCAMVPILEEHYKLEYTRNFTGFMQYRAMIENQLI